MPHWKWGGVSIPCLGGSSYKYLGIRVNNWMDPGDQINSLNTYVHWQCNKLRPKKLTVQQKAYVAEAVIAAHIVYTGSCYNIPEETLDTWQSAITRAILSGVAPGNTYSAKEMLFLPRLHSGIGLKALQGLYYAQALRAVGRTVHTFQPASVEENLLVANSREPILQHTIWGNFPNVAALKDAGCTITPNHTIPQPWGVMGEVVGGLAEATGAYDSPAALFGPMITWDGPSEVPLSRLAHSIEMEIAVIQEQVGHARGLAPYDHMNRHMPEVMCLNYLPELPFRGGAPWGNQP